ncbi:alpha/beta fold hydrolase [Streptomyces lydicus]|uniref:alpha/beta fold hydrolase n=1 Tax=Streptomyces lydicus TaxID=47763 RepID=UPI00379926E7
MSTPSGERHADLHYTDQGSGPPVVLVHGVAGGIDTSWGSLLEQLAEHHRVIAVDNPGSGNSPLPDGPLQLDALTDNIALMAEHAGLERYTVVGYSMGSTIAVRHAIRYPHRTAALALIAGFACPDPRLRLALRTWRDLLDADAGLLGRYLLQQSCGPATLAQLDHAEIDHLAARTAARLPPGTRQHIDLALSVDVRDDLPHVDAPALIIAAAEDLLVTPSHSDVLAQGIKDSRLIQVLAGHDAPAEQSTAITAHIHALTHR